MIITFSNGTSFEYINAFGLENDYHKGIKRPSLEIHMPANVISYNQLETILKDASNLKEIVLTGDETVVPVYSQEKDEFGNQIIDHYETVTPPVNTYCDYDIKGKITVDDEEITIKLFKKSDLEIENEKALAIIDQLLIAMEV